MINRPILFYEPLQAKFDPKQIVTKMSYKNYGRAVYDCPSRNTGRTPFGKQNQQNTHKGRSSFLVSCYKCLEMGHYGPDCPNIRHGNTWRCKDCYEYGHLKKDCPYLPWKGVRFNPKSMILCMECGNAGHNTQFCPNRLVDTEDYLPLPMCLVCGNLGHNPLQCPEREGKTTSDNPSSICSRCNWQGHDERNCIFKDMKRPVKQRSS